MSGFPNSIISVCVSLGFLYLSVLYCNCLNTTLTPVDPDVVEGSDITFVCTVSSTVNDVNWQLDVSTTSFSKTMGVQNEGCALGSTTSFLHDTTKYSYTCTSTVYQVTVKNVQRSQHNDIWSCYPLGQSSGPTSTINVQVSVSSVSITPSSTNPVDAIENTVTEFTCQESASRPDASVTWYKIESGVKSQINQNITSSTTNDDFSVTTSTLKFVPSRQQDGVQIYCTAKNTVNTSPIYSGIRTLNVLYKASITSFVIDGFTNTSVTVNENHPTPFTCNVDSNPSANISLKKHTGIVKSVTSEKLEHTIEGTCLDAGTYTCSARNEHNGDVPIETLHLFVNCRPRSAEEVIQNRTSEKGQTYTITFNVIAYPVPIFVWWKLVEGTWTKLESDNKYVIKSSGLQTNLTINELMLEDFTTYKLVTKNDFDEIEQLYMLQQYDVPNPPTNLRLDEAFTTTASVFITWKPGNNGGLPQTFHIRYKKGSSSTWNYIDVTDNGDKIMNYSINGLAEKTHYDIVIYASNEKGNSTESNVYKTFTKENEGSETSNIGSVVGYSVGAFFILVLLITFLVWRFRSKRANSGNQGAYQSDANETNAIPTIAELYRNEESASNYETLAMQNRDVSNYSALADLASDQLHDSVVYDNVTME